MGVANAAPAVADMEANLTMLETAKSFLKTAKYTAGKNVVASGAAGTPRTDAVSGELAKQTTNSLATGAMVNTGMKTTFAAVYTSLAAKLLKASVTDMSAGSLSLAAAAAGITALAMAF